MSTNKTENYQLHAWELGDDFLLSEINENFGAIDGVLPQNRRLRVAAGSYLGTDRDPNPVSLGFRPRVVVLTSKFNRSYPLGTVCVDGSKNSADIAITDDGFEANDYANQLYTSTSGYVPGTAVNPYSYLAFWWEE